MNQTRKNNTLIILFFGLNILYLKIVWLYPHWLNMINAGPWLPLTKLWFTNMLNFFTFNGFDHFYLYAFRFYAINRTLLIFGLMAANLLVMTGMIARQGWARRGAAYLCVSLMAWGLFWPVIADRAIRQMDTYMKRAYYASVYNKYWQPIKLEYCVQCKHDDPMRQYEHVYYHTAGGNVPGSYHHFKPFVESLFREQAPDAVQLVPAYWGIYRVSQDAYRSTRELYQLWFLTARGLFYVWFLIIPLCILVRIRFNPSCATVKGNP